MNKENMYVVIKREDALQYLTEIELQSLEHLLLTIEQGRANDGKKSFNKYYVCNVDEPYAQVVHGVIIGGEATKANNNNAIYCPNACGAGCSEYITKKVQILDLTRMQGSKYTPEERR